MEKKYIDYLDTRRGPRTKYDDYAWQVDGGANDEGYSFIFCSQCRRDTEHDIDDCIECFASSQRRGKPMGYVEY